MSISTTIKGIQDIMRQDAGVDGDAQRIAQLVWMLFLKMFDANEEYYEWEEEYASPIPEQLRWRNWAADDEGITGDELLSFVNNELFPALKGLAPDPQDDPRGYVVQEVFADSYNYMKNGTLMRQVINKINTIDFLDQKETHLFNDIYEKILRDLQSAGNAGEYYTPRAVTQFMTEMTDPRLGDRVLDPACGTGGFLVGALEHLRAQATTADQRAAVEQQDPRRGEEAAAPHAVRDEPVPPRRQSARRGPRQRPDAQAVPGLHRGRPGRCGADQPALRRRGGAGGGERFPGRLPDQGDGRPLPGPDHPHL